MPAISPSLPQSLVSDLRTAVRGDVITPEDDEYRDARAVRNGRIDRFSAVIVRVTSTDDTAAPLRFARGHDLRIAVRGGDHHVTGRPSSTTTSSSTSRR